EDQVSHVELSREIVRRFNTAFGFEMSDSFWSSEAAVEAAIYLIPHLPPISQRWEAKSLYRTLIRRYASEIGIGNFLDKMGKHSVHFSLNHLLKEPDVLLTETPRIPGLDGRKMSKSYGNTIMLSESDDDIRKKTKVMVTDPARKRRTDPGNPDVCPVYD